MRLSQKPASTSSQTDPSPQPHIQHHHRFGATPEHRWIVQKLILLEGRWIHDLDEVGKRRRASDPAYRTFPTSLLRSCSHASGPHHEI